MADLGSDLVQRARHHCQSGDIKGVPVSLDDLRGYRCRLQSQPLADLGFVLRIKMAECANRARELADAHVFRRKLKARDIALHLAIPVRQLQSEGSGLSVDAV